MLVRCIYNDYLKAPIRKDFFKYYFTTPFSKNGDIGYSNVLDVKINSMYVVQALMLGPVTQWVYLDFNGGPTYPLIFPIELFQVVDFSISRYWEFSSHNFRGTQCGIFAIKEWAKDEYFVSDMFDGANQQNILIYNKYKKLMELEFNLPWVEDMPEKIEGDAWVYCPLSDEAWQVDMKNAMTINPKTKKLMRNPYYDD